VVVDYVDGHRERVVEGKKLGVESICAVLDDADVRIAPRTLWAAKAASSAASATPRSTLRAPSGDAP